MNIFLRELKSGRKAFLFWSIGLLFIVFAGMTKYTGFAGNTQVTEIFSTMPKIVLAVFGMTGVDISSLAGFYVMLAYYVMICAAIYGVSLGANAVNRESIDKTYEFVFTKPRSRNYILLMKLKSGLTYLLAFSLLNYILSVLSIMTITTNENINSLMITYSLIVFLVGLLFFSLAAFIATMAKKTEKGALYANLCFLFAFVVGMVYDMFDHVEILRYFTPLRYFLQEDLVQGKVDLIFILLPILLSAGFLVLTFVKFDKKDLNVS